MNKKLGQYYCMNEIKFIKLIIKRRNVCYLQLVRFSERRK